MGKIAIAMGHEKNGKQCHLLQTVIKNTIDKNITPIITNGSDNNKCHAEMRIIEYLRTHTKNNQEIYIGISKLCCAGCNLVLHEGKIMVQYENNQVELKIDKRGIHGNGFEWSLINGFKDNPDIMRKLLGDEAYDIYDSSSKKSALLSGISSILATGLTKHRQILYQDVGLKLDLPYNRQGTIIRDTRKPVHSINRSRADYSDSEINDEIIHDVNSPQTVVETTYFHDDITYEDLVNLEEATLAQTEAYSPSKSPPKKVPKRVNDGNSSRTQSESTSSPQKTASEMKIKLKDHISTSSPIPHPTSAKDKDKTLSAIRRK